MKHFKLTSNTKTNDFGVTLHQIELTIDCKWGKAGDLGGWIEKDENLSGDAWVYGDAQVYGDARVYGDAWEKSPLQIQGTKHFVNECKKGFLKIGCCELSFEEWMEKAERIGKENNYTPGQIKEYKLYINLAIELNKLKS